MSVEGCTEPISVFISSAVVSPIRTLNFFLIYSAIALSQLSPATLKDFDTATPPDVTTATSVVPPPISTIIFPLHCLIGSPAPIAAATGSSISDTPDAPASTAAFSTALCSTSVIPYGIHTMT